MAGRSTNTTDSNWVYRSHLYSVCIWHGVGNTQEVNTDDSNDSTLLWAHRSPIIGRQSMKPVVLTSPGRRTLHIHRLSHAGWVKRAFVESKWNILLHRRGMRITLKLNSETTVIKWLTVTRWRKGNFVECMLTFTNDSLPYIKIQFPQLIISLVGYLMMEFRGHQGCIQFTKQEKTFRNWVGISCTCPIIMCIFLFWFTTSSPICASWKRSMWLTYFL